MAEPEAILIEHYKAVRDEEMERIRHRDQYLVLFVSSSGLVGGIYINNPKWWGLLAVVPFLSAVTSFLYAHTDVTLGELSQWLRHRYTKVLAEYKRVNGLTYDLVHWDGSETHRAYVRKPAFALRYFAVAIILAGIGGVATIMAWPHLASEYPRHHCAILVMFSAFSVISFITPVWAWRKRIGQVEPP